MVGELSTTESELSRVRGELTESLLKSELIMGETTCMRSEVRTWKERCDVLMLGSDMAAEWTKFKAELSEAQSRTQELTKSVSDVESRLAESSAARDQLAKELEQARAQAQADRLKSGHDMDARAKQLDMVKVVMNELKEMMITVQRELQLNSGDWSLAGRGMAVSERLRSIKADLATVRQSIVDKIRADREEIAAKKKAFDEQSAVHKRSEELDAKLREKDTRIGQLINSINSMKLRMQAHNKQIDELNKTLADAHKLNAQQLQDIQLLQQQLAQQQQQQQQQQTQQDAAVSSVPKSEHDALKSKFLKSQIDIDNLKKQLLATSSNLREALSKQQQQQQQQPPAVTQEQQAAAAAESTTPAAEPTSKPSDTQQQQQQQPPTAYITPSRITAAVKVQPSQQQQQQQQQATIAASPSSSILLRRTAAVQPTSHDSGVIIATTTTTTPTAIQLSGVKQQPQQQAVVNPLATIAAASAAATTSAAAAAAAAESAPQWQQQQTAPTTTTSTMSKRTREEDDVVDEGRGGSGTGGDNDASAASSMRGDQAGTSSTRGTDSFDSAGNNNTFSKK